MEVFDADFLIADLAIRVRLTILLATCDSATGKHGGEHSGLVVTSGTVVDAAGPAEVGADSNRMVDSSETALVEVAD